MRIANWLACLLVIPLKSLTDAEVTLPKKVKMAQFPVFVVDT